MPRTPLATIASTNRTSEFRTEAITLDMLPVMSTRKTMSTVAPSYKHSSVCVWVSPVTLMTRSSAVSWTAASSLKTPLSSIEAWPVLSS